MTEFCAGVVLFIESNSPTDGEITLECNLLPKTAFRCDLDSSFCGLNLPLRNADDFLLIAEPLTSAKMSSSCLLAVESRIATLEIFPFVWLGDLNSIFESLTSLRGRLNACP